jgi:hypothetical protein
MVSQGTINLNSESLDVSDPVSCPAAFIDTSRVKTLPYYQRNTYLHTYNLLIGFL